MNFKAAARCAGIIASLLALNGAAAFAQVFQADPTIFHYKGRYYLYGTDGAAPDAGTRVLVSSDGQSFKSGEPALKKGDAYGTKGFWAPQVWRYGRKFYMAYTANEHIAIATSDAPTGPFKGDSVSIIPEQKTIDPYVFIDDDGKKYLFHVEFKGGNKIYAAEMKNDFSGIIPSTDVLCVEAQALWETVMASVVEGPTVIKHNGWYYLIYSANHYLSKSYAVGYAVSKSPLGPWEKSTHNPILNTASTGLPGVGHGDLFFDDNGKMYYVCHTHNSDSVVSPRKTGVVSAYFEKDKNGGADELVMDGKTFSYLKLTR
ncbi:MAG: glycoside hydrolase family 43 protein [Bacteroidetes bacterium]|nr:glycoside hydrolase family 43 protein [Bacteroidota bacterium]